MRNVGLSRFLHEDDQTTSAAADVDVAQPLGEADVDSDAAPAPDDDPEKAEDTP